MGAGTKMYGKKRHRALSSYPETGRTALPALTWLTRFMSGRSATSLRMCFNDAEQSKSREARQTAPPRFSRILQP